MTPITVARQTPLSVGFSRQEPWSGLPFPSPGDLPNPGITAVSPALASEFLTTEPPGKSSKASTHTCLIYSIKNTENFRSCRGELLSVGSKGWGELDYYSRQGTHNLKGLSLGSDWNWQKGALTLVRHFETGFRNSGQTILVIISSFLSHIFLWIYYPKFQKVGT